MGHALRACPLRARGGHQEHARRARSTGPTTRGHVPVSWGTRSARASPARSAGPTSDSETRAPRTSRTNERARTPRADHGSPERDPLRRWRLVGLAATVAIVLSVPLYLAVRSLRGPRVTGPPEALYVGSERCAPCHKAAYDAWKGSHHELAMQAAREGTVLGDFNDATFALRGKTWRFFRRGEKFMVLAEGPDDALHEYEVAYTFGIDPLQQYLIPFPGGRLQCLSVAWDTRAQALVLPLPRQGHPPDRLAALDAAGAELEHDVRRLPLDRRPQALRRAHRHLPHDLVGDHGRLRGVPRARLAPRRLGGPARHGPAAGRELRPAHADVGPLEPRGRRPLRPLPRAPRPDRGPGRCRATPLLDRYLPVLLTPGTFWPDGQILDEDYEYHGFIQSKMYANNVSCRDCHDVHRAKRRTDGNELCTRCHRADTYDTETHHFHKKVYKGAPSAGALCTSCHMPGQYYMVVHFRLDHSLRVPRPDLSASIGTPNACSAAGCHADKSVAWAVEKYDTWYGKQAQAALRDRARGRAGGTSRGGSGARRSSPRTSSGPRSPAPRRSSS